MNDIEQQIKRIEEEMSKTPYHKGTEGWFGLMRAKIAKLKAQLARPPSRGASSGEGGFAVKKFGDATVVLVGFPSVGKSTLLNALTNAKSPTAEYAFTTVSVIPGMMEYNEAQIQILDVPGLIEGAASGKGKGREVLSVVRGADLLLIIAEAGKEEDQWIRMVSELEANGVRINQEPPRITVKKSLRGGVKINTSVKQSLSKETIIGVAKEFGLINGEIVLWEKLSLDRLVDAFAENRVYTPALFVMNKIDRLSGDLDIWESGDLEPIQISAEHGIGLDKLRERVWETLGLIRVYLKRPGNKEPEKEPMIMHKGQTLQDLLDLLGPDAAIGKTEAKIWGVGARFEGQTVSFSVKVQDGMEVTFV